MGVDAEMMIRYRGEKPTEEQLTRWSWDLCRAIGAGKFFISDGLAPDAYRAAEKAWMEAFSSHPLYREYRSGFARAGETIREDIGQSPKQRRRAIELSCDLYRSEEAPPGKVWEQDGDPIFAAEGEWLLKVSLWTRYYGVGYERGDLLTICAVAEWVEANIPNATVWYGGDSSGVLMEPFGPSEREALRKHLYSQHGRDYFNYGGRAGGAAKMPKPCGLCIPGEPRFNQHGWGGSYAAVNCAGCGKSFVSGDNGETWTEEKKET